MHAEAMGMSDMVHLLWFAKEMPDGKEDVELLIGVYSSEGEANTAIERVKNKSGFGDFHEGFLISPYQVDRDHWNEGFAID